MFLRALFFETEDKTTPTICGPSPCFDEAMDPPKRLVFFWVPFSFHSTANGGGGIVGSTHLVLEKNIYRPWPSCLRSSQPVQWPCDCPGKTGGHADPASCFSLSSCRRLPLQNGSQPIRNPRKILTRASIIGWLGERGLIRVRSFHINATGHFFPFVSPWSFSHLFEWVFPNWAIFGPWRWANAPSSGQVNSVKTFKKLLQFPSSSQACLFFFVFFSCSCFSVILFPGGLSSCVDSQGKPHVFGSISLRVPFRSPRF